MKVLFIGNIFKVLRWILTGKEEEVKELKKRQRIFFAVL